MVVSRSASRLQEPEGRPSARWLPAAVLGVLGLCGLAGGLYMSSRDRASESQTALVIADLRTHISTLKGSASAALLSDDKAMSSMAEAKRNMLESAQLLERGGPRRVGDPLSVRPLNDIQGVVVGPLSAMLNALSETSGSFLDNARGLDAAATVLREAPAWESTLVETLTAVRRLPGDQGNAAIQKVIAATDHANAKALSLMFPSSGQVFPAQKAWVDEWMSISEAVRQVAEAYTRAPDTPPATRTAWQSFSAAVTRWTEGSRALSASQPYRASAQALWAPLLQDATQANAAAESVQLSLDIARNRWLLGDMIALASGLTSLLALAVWSRLTWRQTAQQWAMSQNHRSAQESRDQIDQMTRRLKRILNQNGDAVGGRLEDDPASTTFALTSMINRVLDSREQVLMLTENRLNALLGIWEWLDGSFAGRAEDKFEHLQSGAVMIRQCVETLTSLNQMQTQMLQRIDEIRQGAERGQGVITEGLWNADALRETMQANAKRMKRLGEGSQTVRTNTELVRDICRRLHVYATNAAIEAANMGDEGRGLGVLSQEIDRLVMTISQSVLGIDEVVGSMQSDVQETIAALEQNTSDFVRGSQTSSRALNQLRDLSRQVVSVAQFLVRTIRETERHVLAQTQTHQKLLESNEEARLEITSARRVDEAVTRGRDDIVSWKSDLDGLKRRV